jgi:MYXO-CTERM domain-containing protein
VRSSVTLPDSIAFEDFRLCPSCYDANVVDFSPTAYLAALEEHAIEPMRLMQRLFDERPYTTRLYTTMSAADMTLDPAFTFNADLEDVANVHSAERVIECRPEVYEWEAPWRIELPQGGVIRGTAGDAAAAAWPSAVQDQPANFTIRQLSASGQGRLVADNSDEVGAQLEEYNEQLGLPRSADRTDSGCSVGPRAAGQSLLFGFGALGLGMLGRRRRRRGA